MHSKLMPLTLTQGSREQTLLMYLRRVFNLYKVPVDLAFLLFFRNKNWDRKKKKKKKKKK